MSSDLSQIRSGIRSYILENLLFTSDGAELADDASLLDRGIVDSTGVLEIVMYLEEQFSIKVKDSDMLPENFDSVNNMVRFVERVAAPR